MASEQKRRLLSGGGDKKTQQRAGKRTPPSPPSPPPIDTPELCVRSRDIQRARPFFSISAHAAAAAAVAAAVAPRRPIEAAADAAARTCKVLGLLSFAYAGARLACSPPFYRCRARF